MQTLLLGRAVISDVISPKKYSRFMEPTTPQLGKLIHRMVPSSCSVRIYARLSSDRSIHGSNVGRTDCDCLTDQTFIRSSENLCTASHDSVCLTPYRAKKFGFIGSDSRWFLMRFSQVSQWPTMFIWFQPRCIFSSFARMSFRFFASSLDVLQWRLGKTLDYLGPEWVDPWGCQEEGLRYLLLLHH